MLASRKAAYSSYYNGFGQLPKWEVEMTANLKAN